MKPREIKPGIFSVGAIDWDRRLFDKLIPLPDGTSYNSYLVIGGEKTALIDTVDPPLQHVLEQNLQAAGSPAVDYVICLHAEQDHSGSIPRVLELHPAAKVVTNHRCKGMLIDLLHIPEERFIEVADRETLSLGGKTLEFIYTPWVHWPETMSAYLQEDKLLFSCDFFGSHLATSDTFVADEATVYEAAKRYYAEIMMPFRKFIRKNLAALEDFAIDIIAPSHGPAYDNQDFIISAYRDWVSDEVANEVVLPYTSMHGSTKEMVECLTRALMERGVTVKRFDLARTDLGKLAMALVDAATIVLGAPTVLGKPHPLVAYAAYVAGVLKPKAKFASIIGSYGWGGQTVETLASLISSLDVEVLEPVMVKGFPREADFAALDKLADKIAAKHQAL